MIGSRRHFLTEMMTDEERAEHGEEARDLLTLVLDAELQLRKHAASLEPGPDWDSDGTDNEVIEESRAWLEERGEPAS